ncbi:uncharacterized protein LOC122089266 [Macadamia integrifolia]|uniref:uncharacterized protein LOC122089266 n=1 Tax=Macadamia integrifolia TaxID=60698 RepID=UPI001C4E585E|nr:uncharacterized protein LOC122089266 [Macadamia integrifolia]
MHTKLSLLDLKSKLRKNHGRRNSKDHTRDKKSCRTAIERKETCRPSSEHILPQEFLSGHCFTGCIGNPLNKETEVVASLLYADNGAPVEKPRDSEAPLLTSYDGINYSSCDRPTKLLHGHTSFEAQAQDISDVYVYKDILIFAPTALALMGMLRLDFWYYFSRTIQGYQVGNFNNHNLNGNRRFTLQGLNLVTSKG